MAVCGDFTHYTATNLDVEFYPKFLSSEIIDPILAQLLVALPPGDKRKATLFGNPNVEYTVTYRDYTSTEPGATITQSTTVISWDHFPLIRALTNIVSTFMQEKFTVCIVQCYPSGKVGIGHHRDKEIMPGRPIIGLSLGATRTLEFKRAGCDTLRIPLPSGSLYAMKGETNKRWSHSIIKETKVKDVRYSLTFRCVD